MTSTQNEPQFSTAASTGQTLSSESFAGKVPLAMLFVPDSDTGMDALIEYNAAHSDLAERRVQLLAVTQHTAAEVRDLAETAGITYPLLSDPSQAIFREFGATDDGDDPIACSVVVDKTGTVADKTASVVSPQEMMAKLDILEESSRFEMAVNR